MIKIKNHISFRFFALALAFILFMEMATDEKIVQAETAKNETPPIEQGQQTPEPSPTSTPAATQSLKPTSKPKQIPHVKRLKKVSGIKLVRYATSQIKVAWKKNTKAKYYRIYCSKKKAGNYRLAGVTKNTQFVVKRLKNNTTYYFYVQACAKKKESASDSAGSHKVHIKTRTFQRKTVFAGDSICQAIAYPGWAYPSMSIPGKKKVIAFRGLNTVTFHTKRIFRGKTGLQKLIAEKPYRVYMCCQSN